MDMNTQIVILTNFTCAVGPILKDIDTTPHINRLGVCEIAAQGASSACNLGGNVRRLCCCVKSGQVDNDPHIHTLRGAHYTLLKSGNFLAWSFSKDPVHWQLLAAYSGARLLDYLSQSKNWKHVQKPQRIRFYTHIRLVEWIQYRMYL